MLALAAMLASVECKRRVPAQRPVPEYPDAGVATTALDATVVVAPAPDAAPPPDAGPPPTYLKGSTHVHTVHSGDSSATPAQVAAWYEDHGYDFIVVTDHNRVADLDHGGELLVLRGIELTNNPGRCDPPPPEPNGKCRIHVNSLFVTNFEAYEDGTRPPKIDWRERNSIQRVDLYQAAITKSEQLGGLAQLNHPTWHWGTDGALLAELGRRGMVLFEVANTAFARWNRGTGDYPSTEQIWDAALTEGVLIYGVASDDAHHYKASTLERRKRNGKSLYPAGNGWVMVRADKTAESIRAALERGEFYASTGVELSSARRAGDDYIVEVAGGDGDPHEISLIGPNGQTLASLEGRRAEFDLSGRSGYVRVVVKNAGGQRAWTQPVMLSEP